MNARPLTRRRVLAGLGAGLGSGLLAPGMAAAQGFAGLGGDALGFAEVEPGRALAFPDDFGLHPGFRVEWWYVTANLEDSGGRPYGAQWTLFRQSLAPPGAAGQDNAGWTDSGVWMGHAAVTSARTHRFDERLGRGGIGQAGVEAAPFRAWIDNWTLAAPDGLDRLNMQAASNTFSFDLDLTAEGPVVAHGEDGYSRKSERGQASYYFSQPFLAARGALNLDGEELAVTGQAWLDREWSSKPLASDQLGWSWFALHMDSGEKLMAFRLRSETGPFRSGTWIAPDGSTTPLGNGTVEMLPITTRRIAGRGIPVRWQLLVPSRDLDVVVSPLNQRAWNPGSIPYWEGPVTAQGSHPGRGYLELTGY